MTQHGKDDVTQTIGVIAKAEPVPAGEARRFRFSTNQLVILTLFGVTLALLGCFMVFTVQDMRRDDAIREILGRDCISQGGVWHEGSCFYSRQSVK